MFAIMPAQSQNLLITSDSDCMLMIDGEKKAELKSNQPVNISVGSGDHILLAITADKKYHFRNKVKTKDDEDYPIKIAFVQKINHQEHLKSKQEKRKNQIETYRKLRQEIIREIADDMVLVSENSFEMGDSNGEADEMPVKKVTVNDFYISKYEVTQKQWIAIMESNPGNFFECENCPVERVNWYDAILFCNVLSKLSGYTPFYKVNETQDKSNHNFYDHIKWTVTIQENANGYRLPTEAEWEFAASNQSENQFAGSDDTGEVAWTLSDSNGSPHPVGQKKPNKLGLYDMSGNVWEWCYDWYSPGYYTTDENSNPKGPEEGQLRIIRGGGWMSHAIHSRVHNRDRDAADNKNNFTGFRIVRNQ